MLTSHISGEGRKMISSYQVIIRLDTKKFSEISECQWSIRLKSEVWVVMCWSQIAPFTAVKMLNKQTNKQTKKTRERERERTSAKTILTSNSSSINPVPISPLVKHPLILSLSKLVSQRPTAIREKQLLMQQGPLQAHVPCQSQCVVSLKILHPPVSPFWENHSVLSNETTAVMLQV